MIHMVTLHYRDRVLEIDDTPPARGRLLRPGPRGDTRSTSAWRPLQTAPPTGWADLDWTADWAGRHPRGPATYGPSRWPAGRVRRDPCDPGHESRTGRRPAPEPGPPRPPRQHL